MLASNTKRIFCNTVTCFGTKIMLLERESSARVLQLLLTSCLKGSKGTAFNLFSNWSFTAYTLQLPSISDISVLQTAFKKSCSSKRGLLTLTTWDLFDTSRLITPVAPNFSTEKLESTYLTPARAKVRTSSARNVMHLEQIIILVAGWPGLDKGTFFLVLHVWNSHTHHSLSSQEISSFPKNRQDWVFQSI